MPAPKSILIDIHERGLDPTVPHKAIGSDGRIKAAVSVATADEKPKAVKPKTKPSSSPKETKSEVKLDESAVNETLVKAEGVGSVESEQKAAVENAEAPVPSKPRNALRKTNS